MKIVLIAGGSIDEEFCMRFLTDESYDRIIAIDRGLEFLHEHAIVPDLIVGDFDSLPEGILENYEDNVPVRYFKPEKDATDMEIGVRCAIEMGADGISVLGGTGNRLDHVLGNIQTLMIPLRHGVEAYIVDDRNRIRLLNQGLRLEKNTTRGTYVSLLPLTTTVEGLTMTGFKYPLDNYTLTSDNSLGISNEIVGEWAEISFDDGILIMIESQD